MPSAETRAKISAALKGRVYSPETLERMRAAAQGRRVSDETRALLSERGRGRTQTLDARRRIGAAGALRERKHGHSSGGIVSPTYQSWMAMKRRCLIPTNASWKWYGGRGIAVCERWQTFENFLADMGERPKGRTLDRRDNNGNYGPDNCRWATAKEQIANRRLREIASLERESV